MSLIIERQYLGVHLACYLSCSVWGGRQIAFFDEEILCPNSQQSRAVNHHQGTDFFGYVAMTLQKKIDGNVAMTLGILLSHLFNDSKPVRLASIFDLPLTYFRFYRLLRNNKQMTFEFLINNTIQSILFIFVIDFRSNENFE